ncbi:MAG: universal stress protein [Polyangiaceae bacterium]
MIPNTSPRARAVVLCATDLTNASRDALHAAVRFSSVPGGELHLVHVSSESLEERSTVEKVGAALATSLREIAPEAQASFHVSYGVPWRAIVQVAANVRADLLVVGTHSRKGLKRALLGSVASAVVERAPCPVYVARPADYAAAVPEIEPPCPDCIAVQFASAGEKLWCARHSEKHVHGHLHYAIPQGFGQGSQLLHP